MTPKVFDYVQPQDLKSAIDFLQGHPEAKVLAGGQSLLAIMKLRLASPKFLVDLGAIPGLSYIKRVEDNRLAIGSLTTHAEIEDSELLKKYCPILPEMASQIGDQQIRNMGTIGGSLAHADPSGDPPTAILSLDAELWVAGPKGDRVISASEFFVDTFTTALSHDEVLTEIRVPVLTPDWITRYKKYSWRHGDFAIVALAAAIKMSKYKIIEAKFALGSMGSTPIRANSLEDALRGATLDEELIASAPSLTTREANPSSDVHVSAEFRDNVAKVLVKRFLSDALMKVKSSEVSK